VTAAGAPAAPWRLFVALRVPRAVADPLSTVARSALAPGARVRWVDPADLHLTLWFIGPVTPSELPGVADRVAGAAASVRPVECRVAGTGTFGRGRASAAWVGLAEPGAAAVAALAGQLTGGAPHQAHITVCRGVPAAFAADLEAALTAHRTLAWRATTLQILRSHPGRRPAYETVGAFALGTGATA